MLLTKILVSLQILHYCTGSSHPLSHPNSLVKRAEGSLLEAAQIPVQERVEADNLHSAGEFGNLNLNQNVEKEDQNVSSLESKPGKLVDIRESKAVLFNFFKLLENIHDGKAKASEEGDVYASNMKKLSEAIAEANFEDFNQKPFVDQLSILTENFRKINGPLQEILKEKIVKPADSDPKTIRKLEEDLYTKKCKAIESSLAEIQKDMLRTTVGRFQKRI
ncbi:hypothetical protein PtB15_13B366 [Puccinia triticina]|nr:hypothetical protein PtB15_13B366 [Puccinia triticina]